MSNRGGSVGMLCAVAACAMAGCAATTFPPVPGKGGPAWLELTSEHYTVWTDDDPDEVHALVHQMERVHQVIVGVAFPDASRGRILVFALRNNAELSLTQPDRYPRAFAIGPVPPLFQPVIVMSTFSNAGRTDETVVHELSHVISFAVIHRQPKWFAEGLAEYFETLPLDPGSTTVEIGGAPRRGARRKRMPGLVPISTLFAWEGGESWSPTEARLYSTAWALFTFLINEHRAELERFMHLLDQAGREAPGVSTQSEQLWNQAFPSLPLGDVDARLRQWLVSGRHLVWRFNLKTNTPKVRQRALSDAEVHAIHGYLTDDANQERDHVAAALALDPTNVLARLLDLYHRNVKIPAATGRAMAAAHGDDWRAWWLAARAIAEDNGETPEAAAAAARACALIAENPALIAPAKLCSAALVAQ